MGEIRFSTAAGSNRKPLRHQLFFGTLFVLAIGFAIAFYGAVGLAVMWFVKQV